MPVLVAINYDPGTAVTKATTALLAMTALDTTNLRATFTVPASGAVTVRLCCTVHGATTYPQILLGVLNGSTVVVRATPSGALKSNASANAHLSQELVATVTGLTPGASLTWDAAYGVETLLASTGIKYGGPNDTTTNNAFGAVTFEIWDAAGCLVAVNYDPTTAVTLATTGLLALTAMDTTNLRATFTVPPSGAVTVRIAVGISGATTYPHILLGVLDGSTVVVRAAPLGGLLGTAVATTVSRQELVATVTGLTPGASLTWDAAYGVETVLANTAIRIGGPDDTTANNAWGAAQFEVWAA